MKKLHLLLLGLTICLFSACHDKLWDAIDGLDARVAKLEELCKEMNTNIVSIQTIVNVQQSGDYIMGIVEVKKDGKVIGYTITFSKHDSITIYHGESGQNGTDGIDGITPVIGVAQDTDGVYYWTLNGEWLLDDNGNKLPVSGKDGQNGANGTMPQLKIEEGYWYVSYDNGATWTELGKATGEDGQNGDKGDKGDTGDSMFQSVTQDENYVYFTLADGTVIKIAKGDANTNTKEYYFSVSDSTKVCFSKGNLQYQASTKTYRFAENQWDYIGEDNINMSDSYDGWIDLFCYGTGDQPTASSVSVRTKEFVDWGINQIGNDQPNTWHTLSKEEWKYLAYRFNSSLHGSSKVHNISGVVILPDNWSLSSFIPSHITDAQWDVMENNGAIFLPIAGHISKSFQYVNGYYWACNEIYYYNTLYYTYQLIVGSTGMGITDDAFNNTPNPNRYSVRLVKDIK